MNRKDWSGVLVYLIALALVCAALVLMPDQAADAPTLVFQR